MFFALARARPAAERAGLVVPQLLGAARGLAWKSSSRPTRDELMRGSRKGWSIKRQIVPDRVRIPAESWKLVVGDEVEVKLWAHTMTYNDKQETPKKAAKKAAKPQPVEPTPKTQRGKVLEVRPLENRIVVSGVNLQTKRLKAAAGGTGSTELRPGPVHYSNARLIDPSTKRPTRVEFRTSEGRRVRVAAGSKAVVPYPKQAQVRRPTKEDGPRDTEARHVFEVTNPQHAAFMASRKQRAAALASAEREPRGLSA